MAAAWWKFGGAHQLRVLGIGEAGQQVYIDGVQVDAPEGTTAFTGPGGVLLELQQREGVWVLLADSAPADVYNPGGAAPIDLPTVAWWKFALPDGSAHQLRVVNLGSKGQKVFLDGQPMDAPDGTMAFTGPGGAFIELQHKKGQWGILVDGAAAERFNPNDDQSEPPLLRNFLLPTGTHQLRAVNIGKHGQEVSLDGTPVPLPKGEVAFTGPGGSLLQLQKIDGQWTLLVDGAVAQDCGGGAADEYGGGAEASWTLLLPDMSAHRVRVLNIGAAGQQVLIDGVEVPAPEGQRIFTGPGGVLIEIQRRGSSWALLIDGVGIEDYNSRSSAAGAGVAEPARQPVGAMALGLPQGVSHNKDTNMYAANIRVNGKFKHLGDFSTPDEASAKYQEAKAQAA